MMMMMMIICSAATAVSVYYFDVCIVCLQVPLMDIAGRRILLLVPMLSMIIDLAVLTGCLLTQVLSRCFSLYTCLSYYIIIV